MVTNAMQPNPARRFYTASRDLPNSLFRASSASHLLIMADKQQPVAEDINTDVMTPAPNVVNTRGGQAIDRIGTASDANVQPIGAVKAWQHRCGGANSS